MEEFLSKINDDYYSKLYENKCLDMTFESQQDIFDEIQQIDYRDDIEEKEKEIAEIEKEIANNREKLSFLLNKKEKKPEKIEIIGKIILQIQNVIYSLEKKSLKNGNCDIKDILMLIDKINKIIESLIDANLMRETEDETNERSKKLDDLGLKIMELYQIKSQ